MKQVKNWLPRIIVSAILSGIAFFLRKYVIGILTNTSQEIIITLVMFILLILIWTFFANINRQLDKVLPFNKNTSLRIFIQMLLGASLILIVRITGMYSMRDYLPFQPEPIVLATIFGLDVFLALTINLAVISNYLIRLWKESLLKTERLEQERIQMQYQTLRNQVNPHFLFNSFATLQAMIAANQEVATSYVNHLAKVYRYAIGEQERVIVPIEKELEILKRYIEVLRMRYQEGIQFDIQIPEDKLDMGMVHMVLHNLTDNALKHNEVHLDYPLIISIKAEDDALVFSNQIVPRKTMAVGTQQGLSQMKSLYAYYSDTPLVFGEIEGEFVVRIPFITNTRKNLAATN